MTPSQNPTSADYQQERPQLQWWIVGFTDGEGCFSISIFKNKTSQFLWQIMPEFVLTQGESSLSSLQLVKNYFQVGHLYVNKRYDNHREHLYRYCVRNRNDLTTVIIPFFQKYPLKTAKQRDFELFCQVIDRMNNREHLTKDGLQTIARLVGKKLFEESSETIRKAPPKLKKVEKI